MTKITEETKIKDIIPKGWELNDIALVSNEVNGIRCDMIYYKKKQVKDFDWYVYNYFTQPDCPYLDSISPTYHKFMKQRFIEREFNRVPFEIKIGLLKFICDDIEFNWRNAFRHRNKCEFDYKFLNSDVVIPKEFINSIFE